VAAASLHTTAADLTRFLQAHLPGPHGEPIGRHVLAAGTVEQMWAPEASRLGRDLWGLGTILYARNAAGRFVVGHEGSNPPAIHAAVRLDPDTGNGIVVLATGVPWLATKLAGEWVFWETGNADVFAFMVGLDRTLWKAAAGAVGIVAGAMLLAASRMPRGSSTARAC